MAQGRKWNVSSALFMIAAGTALFGVEALEPDTANAQTRRAHPRRHTPPPAPSPVPAPSPGSTAVDPGVRGGSVDAGAALSTLAPGVAEYFDAAADAFADVVSVLGTIKDEDDHGLGPRFNSNGCGSCHAQ